VVTKKAVALGATVVAAFALVGVSAASAADDPVYAGLTSDGSVYRAGDDNMWHRVAAASGLVMWYGELPGTLAEDPAPAAPGDAPPKYGIVLAGLLGDRTVYVAGDDNMWHEIDQAKRASLGLGDDRVSWYGELPGTIGAPIGS
jgi:hypothetical protein